MLSAFNVSWKCSNALQPNFIMEANNMKLIRQLLTEQEQSDLDSYCWQYRHTVSVLKFRTLVLTKKAKTNIANPDQTASEEAVWSGFAMFALDKQFVNSSHERQQFIWNQKEKSVLKFQTLVPTKKAKTNIANPDQTASEEAVWSGFAMFAILTSILRIPAMNSNNLFETRNRKVFKILEHLP